MCEAQVVQVTESNSIRSDIAIPRRDYGVPYSQEHEARIAALDQIPVEISWLPTAISADVVAIDRFIAGTRSGMVFGEHWLILVGPKSKSVETADIDSKAPTDMLNEEPINIHNIVGSELCVSSNDGQKVCDIIRSTISQGNKACVSFENIKSLSGAFLDSALGQLYNGMIQGNIDAKISFMNLTPGRKLIVNEAIRVAKEYYSDPDAYIAKIKKTVAED